MTLADYLRSSATTSRAFARQIGCSPWQLSRWATGARMPPLHIALRIKAATNGAVTPEDFLPRGADEQRDAA